MGVLNEAAIERAVKKNGELQALLLAEQRRTNELLEQLIQVTQGQPRQWHPPAPPWQEPAAAR